jgi:hypothetical protein
MRSYGDGTWKLSTQSFFAVGLLPRWAITTPIALRGDEK